MLGEIAACCYEIPQFIAERCGAILTEDLREIELVGKENRSVGEGW